MAIGQGSTQTAINDPSTGAKAGVIGDRLKVDANFSTAPAVVPAYNGSKARFLDMNATNGGVARGTSITTAAYVTVFNYTGSGQVFSFLVTFEGNLIGADPFFIKFELDGVTIFEITTDDIGTNTIYNLGADSDVVPMGMSLQTNNFRFAAPLSGAFSYSTSAKVSIKKASGGSKQFRAGAIYLTKDT